LNLRDLRLKRGEVRPAGPGAASRGRVGRSCRHHRAGSPKQAATAAAEVASVGALAVARAPAPAPGRRPTLFLDARWQKNGERRTADRLQQQQQQNRGRGTGCLAPAPARAASTSLPSPVAVAVAVAVACGHRVALVKPRRTSSIQFAIRAGPGPPSL
jgi:hypothetical protein